MRSPSRISRTSPATHRSNLEVIDIHHIIVSGFDRNTAHAKSASKRPRYIGFRVNRKIPVLTNADAELGLVGLTVVRACRKAAKPDTAMLTPTNNSARGTSRRRRNGMARVPTRAGVSHITIAKAKATSGGGIFSSRLAMAVMVSNFRLRPLALPNPTLPHTLGTTEMRIPHVRLVVWHRAAGTRALPLEIY